MQQYLTDEDIPIITDRPLSQREKDRMHPSEQLVIDHYETTTGLVFQRFDILPLKTCLQTATPAQVKEAITFLHKRYPQNIKDFSYFPPYVTRVYK